MLLITFFQKEQKVEVINLRNNNPIFNAENVTLIVSSDNRLRVQKTNHIGDVVFNAPYKKCTIIYC